MSQGFFKVPEPKNEPAQNYSPGSIERQQLKNAIDKALSEQVEIPMFIGGKEVSTGKLADIHPPHDIQHLLGRYHIGDSKHVNNAIEAALKAKDSWERMAWENRASIFLKAADLLAGPYRSKINAATMLCQSKNVLQAETDAACELIDFLRFNVLYMSDIFGYQPNSTKGTWNRLEHRPLEGFVFALTPFNFTSIAGNLPTSPALMGNVVVWKPSKNQVYSAQVIMEVLREAGLPDGIINIVFTPGPVASEVVLNHPDLAGVHFTGSTDVFSGIWRTIGEKIKIYKAYPRIVGETGGKDFVLVHNSASVKEVVAALSRGAFEYQGQKCSAASRTYIPKSLWKDIRDGLVNDVSSFKMGGVEDFTNFINAVIDESAYDKIISFIESAKYDKDAEIIIGGSYDKTKGYFIEPTVIETKDPHYKTMEEEIFGPVLTVYIYDDNDFEKTVEQVDKTSKYGLTGSIFARDRIAIEYTSQRLRYAAGNFYINDKPTGAVVGQQPFGGARGSGTNDKAGSLLNIIRWISPRTIKENFIPPTDYKYHFLE